MFIRLSERLSFLTLTDMGLHRDFGAFDVISVPGAGLGGGPPPLLPVSRGAFYSIDREEI